MIKLSCTSHNLATHIISEDIIDFFRNISETGDYYKNVKGNKPKGQTMKWFHNNQILEKDKYNNKLKTVKWKRGPRYKDVLENLEKRGY